jgi:hypothetical protein
MRKPASVVVWLLFSPTGLIFNARQARSRDPGRFTRSWNRVFSRVEILLAVVLAFVSMVLPEVKTWPVIPTLLLVLSWSRINEAAYTFYNDALSSLDTREPVFLSRVERARMALKSYLGLIIYFALIYYFNWYEGTFSTDPGDFFDCLYFSTITITSLGYGDMFPEARLMKAFAMYEALLGLLVVAVAIGTYIGGAGHEDDKKP